MSAINPNVRKYLLEIGPTPLLSREDEIHYGERVQKGDETAREHMIQSNLKLVVKIAKDYEGYGLPLLDLISEGNMGLMKAVDRFDPERGVKFSTYAAWWIKQGIKRALGNQAKTIRLPAHLLEKLSRMRKIITRLEEELGREPSNDEIAVEMKVKPSQVTHWRAISKRPTSLDMKIGDDDTATFIDLVEDESVTTAPDQIEALQLSRDVFRLINRLDKRERDILTYRFGLNGKQVETLETVGERFEITRERVRQIQNAAVTKIREMIEEEDEPDLPDRDAA